MCYVVHPFSLFPSCAYNKRDAPIGHPFNFINRSAYLTAEILNLKL